MQAKNSNALALITVKRKTRNDAIFIYEDKKNASVSNQITTRSERTSIAQSRSESTSSNIEVLKISKKNYESSN